MRSASARRIVPLGRLDLAAQQPQKRRLAAAIRPDQAHLACRQSGQNSAPQTASVAGSCTGIRAGRRSHILELHQPLRFPLAGGKIDPRGTGAVRDSCRPTGRSWRWRYRCAPSISWSAPWARGAATRSPSARGCAGSPSGGSGPPGTPASLEKAAEVALHPQQPAGVDAIQFHDLASMSIRENSGRGSR